MSSIYIETYNQTAITAWNQEIRGIPNLIQACSLQVQIYEAEVQKRKQELAPVLSALAPLEAEESILSTEKAFILGKELLMTIARLVNHEDAHERARAEALRREHERDMNRLGHINTLLRRLEVRSAPYKIEKLRIENLINKAASHKAHYEFEIHKHLARQKELDFLIQDATDFLNNLANHPNKLFARISQSLIKKLEKYDYDHPANQSLHTRICLKTLANKIRFIQNAVFVSANNLNLQDNEAWRNKFACLSGLLWHTSDLLQGPNDGGLFDCLSKALQKTHVQKNVDLPDQFALGITNVDIYAHFMKTYPNDLADISEADLLLIEKRDFELERQNTQVCLEALMLENNLDPKQIGYIQLGQAMIESLDADNALLQKQKGPEPDYKFQTELLKRTRDLALQPNNTTLQEGFQKLIDCLPGIPSLSKKTKGLIVGFLALTILTLSIFAIVSSFGGAAPLFFVAGTVLAKALSISGASLGTLSLFGGSHQFKSGMRKGTSKKAYDFHQKSTGLQISRNWGSTVKLNAAPPPDYEEEKSSSESPTPASAPLLGS